MLRVLAAILGILLTCTACDTRVAGPPAATSGASAPPTRPREVDVGGLDPCALLTTAQRTSLRLSHTSYRASAHSYLYGGNVDQCTIGGDTGARVDLVITLAREVGVERFDDPTLRIRRATAAAAGYRVLVVEPIEATFSCSAVVDVAAGQLIAVQALPGRIDHSSLTQQELCSGALAGADAVTTSRGPDARSAVRP